MTEQEFINKIFEHSHKAKNLMADPGEYNIQRGMAHSISGYVEDLFAVYIANRIGRKDYQYLVDKVISTRLEGKTRSKSFKPDLMIVNTTGLMTHYFDTKTNLGWNRDLRSYLREKCDFIKSIRGQKAWIHYADKPAQTIEIAQDLKYQMVVLFAWNISPLQLKENRSIAAEYADCIDFHVLYTQKEQEKNEYELNEYEFDRLHQTTKKLSNA